MFTEMFKAIFFDNDGILVDTEKYYFEATNQILAKAGFEMTLEMFRELFLKDNHGPWELLKERGFTEDQIMEFRRERNGVYAESLKSKDIFIHGVEDVLRILHGKFQLSVVTSSRKEHFHLIHERTGFLKYMQFVLALGDYAQSKPEPDPYLLAVDRSRFRAEECLVIEDSERGLLAAKRAGLCCWVIPTELTKRGDFSSADKILSNFSQIVEELGRFVK
jgi:HAD superfamily hydrolase (TIGR01509 family)